MNSKDLSNYILSGFTFVTSGVLMDINLVLSIVLGILGIVSAVLSLVVSIYRWYKEAKVDGKISKEEMEDLGKIAIGGLEDIVDKVNETGGTKNVDKDKQ